MAVIDVVPTIHMEAKAGDVARTVLMPGDPLRAKAIAERYLQDAVCFNRVRGMLGYTGLYKGERVSVMGSGMGMASIGIYSYELYAGYGVRNIIRVGTCGAAAADINIRDVVLASKAYSVSNFALVQQGFTGNCMSASEDVNRVILDTAAGLSMRLVTGAIRSGDVFYMEDIPRERAPYMDEVKALEMEAYALFTNAKALNRNAACLLTVTDKRATGEAIPSAEREKHLDEMFTLALDAAIRL